MRAGLGRLCLRMLPLMMVAFACTAGAQQLIAFTFDDLPASGELPPGETRIEVARQVIAALQHAHVPPVYGFVNGIKIQDRPDTVAVLAAWRKAGNLLGNHGWSHLDLDKVPLQQFNGDILRNEPLLKLQMAGMDWHWFRYPYLAEGKTAEERMGARVFLAQHGYKIAGVTMNFNDYEWNDPYARCSEKKDAVAILRLERSYLRTADESIRYYRGLSHQLYGHDVPYVLLMHIGAFDARMLPRLLDLYKRRGFSLIRLEDAEKDQFYRYDVDPKLVPGPDTLKEAMEQRHWPVPPPPTLHAELEATCR